MRVVKERPPAWIYQGCIAKFGPLPHGTIWAYDGVIYDPSGGELPPHLIAHEAVHGRQQAEIGPDEWWRSYLDDPRFRLEQEVEAHQVEYAFFATANRKERRRRLAVISKRLSSSMYGGLVNREQAARLITGHCPLPS